MRSIILVILANLRRRKKQTLLIGVIITASTLIFATAVGTMGSMHRPFENMFESQNAPHMLLVFDSRMHNGQEIAHWWKSRDGVEKVTDVINVAEGKIKHDGKEFSNMLFAEMPKGDIRVDKQRIVEGRVTDSPGTLEAWLPTAFAYGNRISIGDTIGVDTEGGIVNLTVTAIVVDPYFSSGFMSPVRFWVASGTLPLLFEDDELNGVTLGIRLNDTALEYSLWKDFESHLGTPFSGWNLTHEMVRFSYTMLLNIISIILLIFSLVIVTVALYIIYTTIATSVITDYRNIGILKSQGMTSAGIIMVYTLQFGLLSLVAILVGLTGSVFTIRVLLNSMARSLGLMSYDFGLLIPYLLFTLALLMTMVLLAAFLSARGAGRIKPALAIRFGAPPQDYSRRGKNISFTRVSRLPVSALLGLKQIFTDRKQALFTLVFMTVTTFVLVFAVNSFVSVIQMGDNLPMWGFDDSDIYLIREDTPRGVDHETLIAELRSDNRVKNVVPNSFIGSGIMPETDDYPSQNILGNVFEGELAAIHMVNLEGNHPRKDNEISIAINTARKYGLGVGDQFEMYIEGVLLAFEITGIYQTTNNMGQGYRIQMDAVKKAIPGFEPVRYALILHDSDPAAIESFRQDYESRYREGLNSSLPEDDMGSTFATITLSAGIAMLMLSLVFIIVLTVIVFNTTLLNIHREKKLYGIMKASGMTPRELRLSLLSRTLALGLPGILIGVPAGLWGGPQILSIVMIQMGIANYPAVIHPAGTLAAVMIAFAIATLSTWIPSGKVMTISSRNLIIE